MVKHDAIFWIGTGSLSDDWATEWLASTRYLLLRRAPLGAILPQENPWKAIRV